MSESSVHSDIKHDLYWELLSDDVFADIEKSIGRTRTDVITEMAGVPIAIEIQYTTIPISSILRRMREHTKEGFHTLWLIPEASILWGCKVRNLNWIRFIQRLQNGVIFLPCDGRRVIPARVDNALKWAGKGLIAEGRILDRREPADLDSLRFEKGEFDLNITTCDEWWIDTYLEIYD